MSKKIATTVKQDPENEIAVEVLATSIADIAAGIKKLRAGRLNEDALLLLIQHAAPSSKRRGSYGQKVSQVQIKAVLAGIENLEAAHLRKRPAS